MENLANYGTPVSSAVSRQSIFHRRDLLGVRGSPSRLLSVHLTREKSLKRNGRRQRINKPLAGRRMRNKSRYEAATLPRRLCRYLQHYECRAFNGENYCDGARIILRPLCSGSCVAVAASRVGWLKYTVELQLP